LTEDELKKAKEKYSKYHSFKAEKKAVNVRLLTSDITKIKLKAASM
jgi:predicted DNA binding CopG/RHH family protein